MVQFAPKEARRGTCAGDFVRIILLLIAVVFTQTATAQLQCVFHSLRMSEGLSSNKVNAIFRDSHGYVWIATCNGLNRFDGHRIRQYYSDFDPKNIQSNNFCSASEDGGGVMWFGVKYADYTLYYPKEDRFDRDVTGYLKRLGLKKENPNSTIRVDEKKNLWIWGDNGLDHYNFTKKRWRHYNLYHIEKVFTRNFNAYIVQNDLTITILSLKTSRLTTDLSFKREAKNFDGTHLRLFVDSHDGIWLFNRKHDLLYYKEKNAQHWHPFVSDVDCPKIDVRHIDETIDGIVMIAMGHQSLCYYDRRTKKILKTDPNQNNIGQECINYVYTADKTIWIGSEREGIAYAIIPLSGFTSSYFKDRESSVLNTMNNTSIAPDKDGNMWFGTDGDGLYITSRDMQEMRHFNLQDRLNVVVSIYRDRKNRMWVCTYNDGIYLFENVHSTPLHISRGERGLADDNVWCAQEDKQGNVWIGCLNEGVQKWDEKKQMFCKPTIAGKSVMDMALGCDGKMIVATPDGHLDLYPSRNTYKNCGFSDKVFKEYSLSDKNCNQLYFDSRNWLWEGTNNGIIIKDIFSGKYLYMNHNQGLINQVIHGIVEDSQHNMWISTEYGIMRFIIEKGAKTPDFDVIKIQNFTSMDGLQNDLFNMGAIASIGKYVLVGTTYGICAIQPEKVPMERGKSKVYITELLIGPDSVIAAVDANKTYRIPNGDANFAVCFSTLNYQSTSKLTYAYRLHKDEKWSYTTTPEIIFSHLSPGSYTFELCQIADSQRPNSRITRLSIYVCYPWWCTWWAFTLYIIGILGLYFTFRHARKQIKELRNSLAETQRGIMLAMEKRQNERMLTEIPVSDVTVTNADEELKKHIVETIEKHIDDSDFTVEQLSQEVGMSRANLHRKLVAISGMGPLGFIRNVRLSRAKQLLEKSQMTIAEISYAVGFNNPKNFSRYFKEEFGVTPSQYRENYKVGG